MSDVKEYFPFISKVIYNPNAGPDETLVFKHYNAEETIEGRTMADWLRFSVCYWHTFRGNGMDPFGAPTLLRPWNNGSETLGEAFIRLDAAFEFFTKLGIKYYCFHDRDIAPEGKSLQETNANLDKVVEYALQHQNRTGVQLLWATCNLFSHPRYTLGASTSSDVHVYAYAAAQVKKGLDIAKRLDAKNFVFWGGREGYNSLLNTKLRQELDNMATFFKMVVAYKNKIGFEGQLLIEPKPKEPSKHQYDYDAMTVIAFLKTYDLENHFKINVEPNHTTLAGHCYEHDVAMASAFGMLGSIDSNTGSPDLGWDTDQFPMNHRDTTMIMRIVMEQGGLQPGGLNFDCKVRRESTHLRDMFVAHIGAMDAFARGLRCAARIRQEAVMAALLDKRYISFDTKLGKRIKDGSTSLEELEEFVFNHSEPNPLPESGQQEHFEAVFNHYM